MAPLFPQMVCFRKASKHKNKKTHPQNLTKQTTVINSVFVGDSFINFSKKKPIKFGDSSNRDFYPKEVVVVFGFDQKMRFAKHQLFKGGIRQS